MNYWDAFYVKEPIIICALILHLRNLWVTIKNLKDHGNCLHQLAPTTCTNVTERRSRNDDTPVKVNCGDSSPSDVINMSSDNMQVNGLPPSDFEHRGGKKQNTSTFSLEELGKLLDDKLDTKLQNTRHSLASEIKQEFNEVLMKLESEFFENN
ncbi:unnamed protein product [Parnassius apollo]|uniref:(apollo) hypothetical protein n=1 Tax=Parnassius apollo TaxID=110799 RepID=A0A8S3XLT2_PARAO|nr:unnamed protein product [Parnassius apollo]